MDDRQFDALARTLMQSRRAAVAGLMALATSSAAFDVAGARGKKKNRKGCKRKAIKICTGFVCGRRKNNCGKTLNCQCRAGLICLPNGGCGLPCAAGCPDNAIPCACTASGEGICLVRDMSCAALTALCLTTADCPEQTACGETPCGSGGAIEKRCVPLCRG